MSENTDDLEQTVMLAAAAADYRQYQNDSEDSSSEQSNTEQETVKEPELNYYSRQPDTNSKSFKRTLSSDSADEEVQRKEIQTSEGDMVQSNRQAASHSEVVATHYNLIEDKGLQERSKSRIIHLRVFHNWIKSMLINEYLTKIKDGKKQHNPPVKVFDMCSGKGGDLLKWKKGNISHLICSDIAEVSLEQCKERYAAMKGRSGYDRGRHSDSIFTMELIHGDSGKVRYREKFHDPSIKLDLVSCQFAFHYSFESLPQAECWFKNASECLQAGGYFIGTMIDSNEVIARARHSGSTSFGNDVFQVNLYFDLNKPPLFGAKYDFQLEGAVDCAEFLVHFPTFVKLAKKYGLKLVKREKFKDFFERMKYEGKQLLTNMGALETYPPPQGKPHVRENGYEHARKFLDKQERRSAACGTLSLSEWEASSLYLTFVFQKVKNTWNADGTPCYDI